MDQLTYHRIKLNELRKGNLAILEALNGNKKEVDIPLVEQYVSGIVNKPVSQIYRRTRKREIVQARQLIHHFAKKYTRKTTTDIGRACGGYDHSTVLHSYKIVGDVCLTDRRFREFYNKIDKMLIRHSPGILY